jgi:tartrate-resistant acid phosphatase type 5
MFIARCKYCILLLVSFVSINLAEGQKFAIISDIHGAYPATGNVSLLVKSWNPEFIITCGDNNYAYAAAIDSQVGQYYHDFIYPYTGNFGLGDTINRFFPALGNHDEEGGGITSFLSYFTLPGNERYYDFVKGRVHFFCINSNPDEPDGVTDSSVQAVWLQSRLASSTSAYNIVYFHHPAFTSGMHGSTLYMRWPFKQWGATVVLAGHDHDYERLTEDGLPYIVAGLGGGPLYTIYNAIAGSQMFCSSFHGAILANANDDSISFDFIATNDSLVDHVNIMRTYTRIETEGPDGFELFHNYPNPASSGSTLNFYLPRPGCVDIGLYNLMGQKEISISDQNFCSGKHSVTFDCKNLKSGIYFYRFSYEDHIKIEKLEVYHEN